MIRSAKTTKRASTHICIGCGACCRNFSYIQVSQDEIEKIESFTGLAPADFCNISDRKDEKSFMKFKENGDCVFLEMTDGSYACRAYEARSSACREYPANDIQDTTCRMNSNRMENT